MPKRIEEYKNDPAYSIVQRQAGKRLAAVRKLSGLSQTQAGNILSVSQPTWSKWERGINMPDVFVMSRFCTRFCVSLDLLYLGLPIGTHPGLLQMLRVEIPLLLVEIHKDKDISMDMARVSYMAAINQNLDVPSG